MEPSTRPRLKFVHWLLSIMLLAALLPSGAVPSAAQAPPPLPDKLPVYKIITPTVNQDTANSLSRQLGNIAPDRAFTETTHAGTNKFVVFDEEKGSLLEQYGARGGFFAFNAAQAFQEIPANLDYGARDICFYLQQNQLFPGDTAPAAMNCDGDMEPPYIRTAINLATLAGGTSTQVVTGEVFQVPLAINVALPRTTPIYIPVGGPGGHLSLLLTGFDDRPSLDQDLAGLQALAIPTHGISREEVGRYDLLPAIQATRQVINQLALEMPGAVLDLGKPELIYYMEDPAEVQEYSIPVWHYPDATAEVDGEIVNLKGFFIPAILGFLPEVQITSPPGGTGYLPGTIIGLKANVSMGTPPYTYVLELEDGTPLASGNLPSPGELTLTTPALPASGKPGQDLFLRLVVTDDQGVSGSDDLALQGPTLIYLPSTLKIHNAPTLALQYFGPALSPDAALATRSVGVEWIQYYNGHGSNLPGVPGDGGGFYNGMKAMGWNGKFQWANNDAWEKDWRDCSLGGVDCGDGVDRVDFAYFSGHGSPARLYFGTKNDAYNFYAPNARFQNIRWAAFSTCQTLRAGPYVGPGNPPLTHWFNSFRGSYMLMGFHSNMADIKFGPRFVDNLKPVTFVGIELYQNTIREAWVLTAFQMNAGKPAYLYARSNSFNPVNLKLPKAVSADPPPLNPSSIVQYLWMWWE